MLQSPAALAAAGKGAVSFGVASRTAGLISVEVPVEMVFRRVDKPGSPTVFLGNIGYIGPYVRVLEPGDYVMQSLEYFDGIVVLSGPIAPVLLPPEGEQLIDFTVEAGEVLNLGQMEVSLVDRHGTRYLSKGSLPDWYATVTQTGPEVRERFAEDFPALLPVLENRPIVCTGCPQRPVDM